MEEIIIRHADSNNKYIHILKTNVNKSNELSKLRKKKAEDRLDDIKNDWTFKIEGPEEHGEFGSVDDPNVDDEFGKFIDYIEEDTTLTYFFDTDISEVQEKLYVLYYDGKPLYLVQERWNEWKPTKKVYWSISTAKIGIANLPSCIDTNKITIVPYVPKDTK